MPVKNSRFLVIKLDGIGDFALALPALRGLVDSYPDCVLDVVVSSINESWRGVVPWIRNFYTIDFPGYRFGKPRRISKAAVLGRLVSLGIELRKQRYNAAFDMRSMSGDWRGKVVALLSGAPLRVGSTGAGGWALTRVSSDTSVHQSDIALERLRIFDPAVKKVESGMVAISRTRPKGAMPHLVLHPGAGGAIKRWPVENWISLARALANLPGSVTFQFLGGPEDEERLQKITTDSGLEPGRAQVSTTFRETLQILADADLLVGLDSGAAHLAHLVGTPAITIFSGAHDPARWKALGDNTVLFTQIECAPCRLAHCKWETPRCMEAITPATVLSTIEQKLRALGWPAGLGA